MYQTVAFVCVNGRWRFEAFINETEVPGIRRAVEIENGPGSFFSVTLPDVPAHQIKRVTADN